MIKEKECKKCKKVLNFSKFTKSKNIKDGYENTCRKCRQEARKKHVKHCELCNKSFRTANKETKFCSVECQGLNRRKRVDKNCETCNKVYEIIESKEGKHEYYYCSQDCRNEHLKVLMLGKSNPNYNSINKPCDGCFIDIAVHPYRLKNNKYHFCTYECWKENIGQYFTGKDNPNYSRIECICFHCDNTFKRKISQNRGRRNFCTHECYLSSNFNPDITDEDRKVKRNYPEYKQWRKDVLHRDNYTCQCCGDMEETLHAHHFLNYAEHKELRTELSNGITLCESHHIDFHITYGYRNNNQNQMVEYIENHNLENLKGA